MTQKNKDSTLPPSSKPTPTEENTSNPKKEELRGKPLEEQEKLLVPESDKGKKVEEAPKKERGYQETATTSGKQLVVSMDELETEIGRQLQGADSLQAVADRLTALSDSKTLAGAVKGHKAFKDKTDNEIEEAVRAQCVPLSRLATKVLQLKTDLSSLGRSGVHEIAAFRKAWGDAQTALGRGMPVATFVKVVEKQLDSVKQEMSAKPVIPVKGGSIEGGDGAKGPSKDEAMSEVEKRFDVLARKSAPPPDDKNNISEVDLAFLEPMRGFPDIFASIQSDTKNVDISKANEEKVFSIGSGGALAFKGELSDKPGARFYGVLMPKGWLAKYGEELRDRVTKKDGTGEKRSARAPNGTEMKDKHFDDDGTDITVGEGKAFGIRAEESTKAHGQVDIHRDRHVALQGSGQEMSQLELFRKSAMGVVEFSDKGLVLNKRMW